MIRMYIWRRAAITIYFFWLFSNFIFFNEFCSLKQMFKIVDTIKSHFVQHERKLLGPGFFYRMFYLWQTR